MAGHGTHLAKCWITSPPFEAEWQNCHCFRNFNRTGILTEILSVPFRDKNSSALSAPFRTFHCCFHVRKHQIALCSKATKLTINMYITPYTGKFSRLPPAPIITSGPIQAEIQGVLQKHNIQ